MKLLNWEIHGVFFSCKNSFGLGCLGNLFLTNTATMLQQNETFNLKIFGPSQNCHYTFSLFPEYMNIRFIVYKNTNKSYF